MKRAVYCLTAAVIALGIVPGAFAVDFGMPNIAPAKKPAVVSRQHDEKLKGERTDADIAKSEADYAEHEDKKKRARKTGVVVQYAEKTTHPYRTEQYWRNNR